MASKTASKAQDTIDTLNFFLRSELSAVNSYLKALDKVSETNRMVLQECLASHQRRAGMLTQKVSALGAEPAHSPGAWGTIASLLTKAAGLLGEKTMIAALEEGEDNVRDEYQDQDELDNLDMETRRFVVDQLTPEQNETHDLIRNIKRRLA